SLWTRRLPRPSLFPYTTLFRSYRLGRRRFRAVAGHVDDEVVLDPVVHEPAQRCAAGEHFLAAFGADHAIVPGREVAPGGGAPGRSEEHTSELQSRENLVCRLLL